MEKFLIGMLTVILLLAATAGWSEQGENASTLVSDLVIQPGEELGCEARDQGQAASESESLANSGCCKICTVGKACGDTCISRSYTCTKGPGCACDG